MLVQFSVENYKSIKDEIVISFRAEKKYGDSGWVVNDIDKISPVYKCIGLIGPNAAGKSNIIEALSFAFRFVNKTISRKDSEEIDVEVFALSEPCREMPTMFEFVFFHKGVKYVYGFSVNRKEVVEEYLMGYFSAKPKTLFERSEGQHYDFKGNHVKQQKEIAKKTNANRLYMPVAAEWGYEPLKVVNEWFDFTLRQYNSLENTVHMAKEIEADKEKKECFIRELQKADFNVVDFYIKKMNITQKYVDVFQKFVSDLIGEVGDGVMNELQQEIRVVHRNNAGEQLDIALSADSRGTEEAVTGMVELMYMGSRGGLMIEDELGKNFHTMLTQHFLDMVKSGTINPGNAQLFFASHDTKVLNVLNPDQIYLVDKDESGATFVTLLGDYQIRSETNVELGYLKGRFGGIPYMKG